MRLLRRLAGSAAAVAAFALLGSCATPFVPDRAARAPVLDGFGTLDMPVTTASPAAQALFVRGMLQSYAFNDEEAARAFKAALAADPGCAMCAWGVAKAAGPNINEPDRGDLAEARRYLAWAARHAVGATPRERAIIAALADRYGPEPAAAAPAAAPALPAAPVCGSGPANRADPLDIVYAARMRALADAYPDDPDVLVMYAEAAMIATRDDWWDKKTGQPAGDIGRVADLLERALRAHPDHPALNHYLIHAVDASPRPERAAGAADRLGVVAPNSPHLLHMPAHIYVRTGRYDDAVRVNLAAIAAQERQTAALAAQGFAPSADWNGHNRYFLWFAALTDGRGELALEQARVVAVRSAKGESATAEFMRSVPLLTLVRLERWDDVSKEPRPVGKNGVAGPIVDIARGLALARTGRVEAARERAAAVQAALDDPVLKGKTLMADDPARIVLDILAARLRAEILVADGRIDAAGAALARAGELETALNSTEPPLLGSASRVALGNLMLRAHRWADAERAYRDELAAQPASGWALAGLQQALAGAGRTSESTRTRAEAEQAWAAADAAVRESFLR